MTVRELIEALKQMPAEARVYATDYPALVAFELVGVTTWERAELRGQTPTIVLLFGEG